MSKASTLPFPSSLPKKAAAMAPAAGPDSSMRTGARSASATWVSPPLESMRSSGAGMLASARRRPISSKIALGQRLDIGIGYRGGRALEFAHLGRHLVRGGHGQPRQGARHDARGLRLVTRVRVGVKEDDGDGLHARLRETPGPGRDFAAVETMPHAAVRPYALRHLQAQVARHQGLGLGDGKIVEVELPLSPDLQRVGEAGGGEEPSARALALDEGVGEQRGGMDYAGEARRLEPALGQ